MKKSFLIFLLLFLFACNVPPPANSTGVQATITPSEIQRNNAFALIQPNDIIGACDYFLAPLGPNPGYNAVKNWYNHQIVQVEIFPVFKVPGTEDITIRFGTNQINAYKVNGTKVYTLTGEELDAVAEKTLKQNNNVIGYLASFTVNFDLMGEPALGNTTCEPIYSK